MSRLFDAYVIANWTAAEGKKLGEQSLWIAVVKRDVRMRLKGETHNVATRAEGEALLAEILADLNRRGDRALIGFDVPLGFPVGTAARLSLKDATWSGLWAFLADNVRDKADNTNNRYQVAAKMNRLMTDQAWPFWGHVPDMGRAFLVRFDVARIGVVIDFAGFGCGLAFFRDTQLVAAAKVRID